VRVFSVAPSSFLTDKPTTKARVNQDPAPRAYALPIPACPLVMGRMGCIFFFGGPISECLNRRPFGPYLRGRSPKHGPDYWY
jgi:hypothetical protein